MGCAGSKATEVKQAVANPPPAPVSSPAPAAPAPSAGRPDCWELQSTKKLQSTKLEHQLKRLFDLYDPAGTGQISRSDCGALERNLGKALGGDMGWHAAAGGGSRWLARPVSSCTDDSDEAKKVLLARAAPVLASSFLSSVVGAVSPQRHKETASALEVKFVEVTPDGRGAVITPHPSRRGRYWYSLIGCHLYAQ